VQRFYCLSIWDILCEIIYFLLSQASSVCFQHLLCNFQFTIIFRFFLIYETIVSAQHYHHPILFTHFMPSLSDAHAPMVLYEWKKGAAQHSISFNLNAIDTHSFLSRDAIHLILVHVFTYFSISTFAHFSSLSTSVFPLFSLLVHSIKKANEIFLHTPGRSKEKKKIYIWKKSIEKNDEQQ